MSLLSFAKRAARTTFLARAAVSFSTKKPFGSVTRAFQNATRRPTSIAAPASWGAAHNQQCQRRHKWTDAKGRVFEPMDGNGAAAYIAYGMSDNAFIYPISPATPMGEYVDTWASKGVTNVFGRVPDVNQMQSEGGAAGALHGTISAGALSSTFTASQGLLLMIPNMYLIAGELQPTVFHVSARALARMALSIFNDHSDVMAVRQTGWALLSSHSVQEALDLALVAHISTLKARVPFLHFFDGLRTSHEIQKIHVPSYEEIKKIVPWDKVDEFRARAFNPKDPTTRGTGMRPDTYMQATVAANTYYNATPAIVEEAMADVEKLVGRKYKLFDYHGDPDAEKVVVVMGSASGACSEVVDHLRAKGQKVGVVKPRLYRPWSSERFLEALPKTAKKIAVLDRTKEDGALGLPLYLDVVTTLMEAGDTGRKVVNGSFGLASKEFTPTMALSVFENLDQAKPRNHFVVGINDDVTHTSLPLASVEINTTPAQTNQAMFWGRGGDGTIGANKTAIKMISDNTDQYAQGYFAYDSKKQGGVTMSHLRFGPNPLFSSTYQITHANYVAVHNPSYLGKFDMIHQMVPGGVLVANTPYGLKEMDTRFPTDLKQSIAKKKLKLYAIDANQLALDLGLGKRINMIMQGVYFHLSGVLKDPLALLNNAIDKMYGGKGEKIVNMNKKAVSQAVANLRLIEYPANWGQDAQDAKKVDLRANLRRADEATQTFVKSMMDPMLSLRGDKLPVSAFEAGNQTGTGTTAYERRVIAVEYPVWKSENCTQCNYCSVACPHAAIRPFLFNKEENQKKPESLTTIKTKGSPELAGLNYSIQIAPFGCTGCAICVAACPDDALAMQPFAPLVDGMDKAWDYAMALPPKDDLMDRGSVKGSQFQTPLLEFSGACSGCGETPYVKLLTQLFGERMIVANSSGCSSVWGGTFGEIPYAKNKKGHGPAWGRSLFEDTAEYGLGMYIATRRLRQNLQDSVKLALEQNALPPTVQPKMQKLLKAWNNNDECSAIYDDVQQELVVSESNPAVVNEIAKLKNYIPNPSHWIIGGDGWAYDIGYGGLDHVLASGANVNILVLDTEMYSNTGGQVSKATPAGSFAKYAMSGKKQNKKDLGGIAMTYGHVYVASVSLSANWNQCVQAFKEAESYDGPSIVIAYATCVDWGHTMGTDAMVQQQRDAVDSGYWPLYRFDPRRKLADPDASPLQVDSSKIRLDMQKYLNTENRFTALQRQNKEKTAKLQEGLAKFSSARLDVLRERGMDRMDLLDRLKAQLGEAVTSEKVLIAYASETGNAEDVANSLAREMKGRGVRVSCKPLNDIDVSSLSEEKTVFFIAATCGQGEWPANAKGFWTDIQANTSLPPDFLKNTQYAVFGLGDSGYVFFNATANALDKKLDSLGAKRLLETGLADDKADGGMDASWSEWKPQLWGVVNAKPPPEVLPPESYMVQAVTAQEAKTKSLEFARAYVPNGANETPLLVSKLMTPPDYDRDIRHFEFDLTGLPMPYEMGDSLGIWPKNKKEDVDAVLNFYGLFADDVLQIEDVTGGARKVPLPSAISAYAFFEGVLDMFGKPKRRFYEMMATLATDPAEKARLKHLLSPEGKADLKKLTKEETPTYFDLLKMFPKTKPTIAQLLDYVPDIRPRLYSIASASRMHTENRLHLLIVADDWKTKSGRYRHGLCTQYLRELDPSKGQILVNAKVNPAAVAYPTDLRVPLILSGLGTGLAPLRAAIEERVAARKAGEETGPMALFFGSRHEKQEFPYGDQFKKFRDQGVLTHIHTAFSRDQKEKIYIQQRIAQQSELIYDYLITKKGSFYYCGTGGSAVDDIQKAVEGAFVKCGGMTPKEAADLVTDMRIKGRYNVESW